MAPPAQYEFRPAFRDDDYEWSPRPPEPAEPWTRLAKHALARRWKVEVADAASGQVWELHWKSVNRSGTRGGGLALSAGGPDDVAGDEAGLALLLEHCRQAEPLLSLPGAAWHLVREGGAGASAILAAAGRPAPVFHLRNLAAGERDLLAALGPLVCLEAAPGAIERATRWLADWALQASGPADWLRRVVPPDRDRALAAFFGRNSPLPRVLTGVSHLDATTILGSAAVERAVRELVQLADLAGAGGVRLRVSVQPPDGPFALRLAAGELRLPIDHELSLRLARALGLEPPVTPPRPAPPPPAPASAPAAPAAARRSRRTPAAAGPSRGPTGWGPVVAVGLTAMAGAFLVGRVTAPRTPAHPPRARLADLAAPATSPPPPAVRRAPGGSPGAAPAEPMPALALPLALLDALPAGGSELAEPTCTANGDVLRLEPDRLVVVPCGTREPREAFCVAGWCRQAGNPDDDPPETACGRDGAALVLDRGQRIFRPASPPTFACPAAWYGVPAPSDPLITLPDPAPGPRGRAAGVPAAAWKQSLRGWAQIIRASPRQRFTVVGYPSGAPRPRDGCTRAEARVRAAVARALDGLVAEKPSLEPQLLRPGAVRTCAAAPGQTAEATPPVTHLFLVRGVVPGCRCSDTGAKAGRESAPRSPDRRDGKTR